MCVNLNDKTAKESEFFGCGPSDCVFANGFGTDSLISKITDYRNFGPRRRGESVRGPAAHGCLETFGRRALAEVTYLGLAVVAVVEAVARIAFALLALIPSFAYSCCCEDGSEGEPAWSVVIGIGIAGLILGPDAIMRCFMAAAKNPFVERFEFKDLALCHCL